MSAIPLRNTTTGTSSSSTTSAAATPSFSSDFQKELVKIRELYLQAIGRPMPDLITDQVLGALQSGVPLWHYEYALRQTAYAPMPSWRYAAAILRRIQREEMSYQDYLYTLMRE